MMEITTPPLMVSSCSSLSSWVIGACKILVFSSNIFILLSSLRGYYFLSALRHFCCRTWFETSIAKPGGKSLILKGEKDETDALRIFVGYKPGLNSHHFDGNHHRNDVANG